MELGWINNNKFWDERLEQHYEEVQFEKYKNKIEKNNSLSLPFENHIYLELKNNHKDVKLSFPTTESWEIRYYLMNDDLNVLMISIFGSKNTQDNSKDTIIVYIEFFWGAIGKVNIEDPDDILHLCRKIDDCFENDLKALENLNDRKQKKTKILDMTRAGIKAYVSKKMEDQPYDWQLIELEESTILRIKKNNGAMLELPIKHKNFCQTLNELDSVINTFLKLDFLISENSN